MEKWNILSLSFKFGSKNGSPVTRSYFFECRRRPFLERPDNLTGPKSYFEIKLSRKIGSVLTSNEVQFVYLADNFAVQFSSLLKLSSGMENKTAQRAW